MIPDSSITPYMSISDFLARKDYRLVAQLAVDDPDNLYPLSALPAALYTDINVQTAVAAACGQLESAVLRSNRYMVSDLQALQGVSQAYMKTILSNIAMYEMYGRRSGPNPSSTMMSDYESAIKALNDLAEGIRIFSFNETQQAGLPAVYQMQPYDYIRDNLVTTRNRSYGLGVRQQMRRWPGGGGCGGGCGGGGYGW
jgi:hypothetical protein